MRATGTRLLLVVTLGAASCDGSAPNPAPAPSAEFEAGSQLESDLAAWSPPRYEPRERAPWSRDKLEVKVRDGVELSPSDVDAILAVAAEFGLREPARLVAGNFSHPGTLWRVRVEAPALEDPVTGTRTHRTLMVSNDGWEDEDADWPPQKRGAWRATQEFWASPSYWDVRTVQYFRAGDHVWEYSTSGDITPARALSLFQALGRKEVDSIGNVELPWDSIEHREGWLGVLRSGNSTRLTEVRSGRGDDAALPEWDVELGVSTGPFQGAELCFREEAGRWLLFDVSHWIS